MIDINPFLAGSNTLRFIYGAATSLISVIQLSELFRNAAIAARLPFTFYFAESLMYLAITIVPKIEYGLSGHLRARDDEREQIEALAVR